MSERRYEKSAAYFCEKHKGFYNVKKTFHKFDFKDEVEKLMAELECGCTLWIATVERDKQVLEWYKSLEKQ